MRQVPALAGGAASAPWGVAGGLDIAGITADSRRVAPGFMFAALPGSRVDGRAFIPDAVSRGAVAVLAPQGTEWPPGVPPRPMLEDPEPRRRLAEFAAGLAGGQPRVMVAVTGTNGKTSTVEFLRQIWAGDGRPAASLGTLGLMAPGFEPGPGLTTPDPVSLSETLAALARAGVQHAAIEASSHGLDQFRLDGVRLAAAAFTNLTRDHLDYHGSMEGYRAAKLRLFIELLPAGAPVVASSEMDGATLEALGEIAARRRLVLRTVGENGSAIRLLGTVPRPDGQMLRVVLAGREHEIALPLPGRFQADNALMAAELAMALGERSALERLEFVAGRAGAAGIGGAVAEWGGGVCRLRAYAGCAGAAVDGAASAYGRAAPRGVRCRWGSRSRQAAADGGSGGSVRRCGDRYGRQSAE